MSYGFIMSPLQFHWFAFLSRAFPITKQNATMPAMQRVCMDQLIFAPIGRLCYSLRLPTRDTEKNRSGSIFYVHDSHRGWWSSCRVTEIPRGVPSLSEGKLLALACSADPQLQGYSLAISNRESRHITHWYLLLTTGTALCLHRRYRMDCLPIPHQLVR